ncbi:MAG: sigma-70 family RNA polymerase sigma factor [Sorangiineae bacterium]|nr:sigma-70 family RNA polymerase sigma factor [Polyangiaceae bacterium]MEB2324823.1 sigma-70 family RNA polymerase sigma factor [Sorangiineae bacterium]
MFASPLVPVSNLALGAAPGAFAGDERELIDGLLADDERAWRNFNTRYGRLIFRCITRVTSRFSAVVAPDDVREIYATLCLSLLANDKRKLRSFEPERGSKLGSWLGMLAIHAAYDFLRTAKREPRRAALTEAEGLSSELPNPHDACVQRQRLGLVEALLADFSDKDREFVTLYYGEGLAPEAIAEQMGISVKTVYSKKHKIRARLETLLTERNLTA